MQFDPTLLRAFVAVHEARGFTRAAQRLHLTQSAVSHQIRRLEEQLGRQLLRRAARSVALTEDGEEFLGYALRALAGLDALAERFKGVSGDTGVVRLGVPDGYMSHRLPVLLRKFAAAHCSVRLDVAVGTYDELRSLVAANELDLAIVAGEPGADEGTPIRRMQFVWVAAQEFAPAGEVLPLAFAPAPCFHRQIGAAALASASVKWRIAFTSPSMVALRAAVQARLAATVLPSDEVERGLRIINGHLGLPPLLDAELTLLGSARRNSAAVAALRDTVLDVYGEGGPRGSEHPVV